MNNPMHKLYEDFISITEDTNVMRSTRFLTRKICCYWTKLLDKILKTDCSYNYCYCTYLYCNIDRSKYSITLLYIPHPAIDNKQVYLTIIIVTTILYCLINWVYFSIFPPFRVSASSSRTGQSIDEKQEERHGGREREERGKKHAH